VVTVIDTVAVGAIVAVATGVTPIVAVGTAGAVADTVAVEATVAVATGATGGATVGALDGADAVIPALIGACTVKLLRPVGMTMAHIGTNRPCIAPLPYP